MSHPNLLLSYPNPLHYSTPVLLSTHRRHFLTVCLFFHLHNNEEINNKEEEFKAYLEERRIPSAGESAAVRMLPYTTLHTRLHQFITLTSYSLRFLS